MGTLTPRTSNLDMPGEVMRRGTYVQPRTIRSLSWLVGLIGLVAAVARPVYAINGATRAGAAVEVPVELAESNDTADSGRTALTAPALPDGARVSARNGGDEVVLSAWDSTVAEQLFARGDAALLGLAIGLGAGQLRPVLESVAAGRPFRAGNARRLV
jgi:hypothetical protein